jgi:tetratricopeptide (TPR) repeat protein
VILTIERAQKLGLMKTPADNFHLVGFYSSINQFSKACELLDNGLKEETIESTPENWSILGGWYQLIHRNDKAIQTFITAAELFPTNAEIEYQAAQVYLNASDEPKAFEHIKACIAKGGTEKPHVGLLFYSYVAMDLQKFNEALKAAHEAGLAAAKVNATDAIKQAQKMEETIKANIQDIENRKQQMKH